MQVKHYYMIKVEYVYMAFILKAMTFMSCVIRDTINLLKPNKYWWHDQGTIMQKTAERVHIVENRCLRGKKKASPQGYAATTVLLLKFLPPNCCNSGTAPQLVLWHILTCQDTIKILKHARKHQQFFFSVP